MDQRPDPAAVTDQRELALADHLHLLAPGPERSAGAVEAAVPQHDALHTGRRGHRVLQLPDRGQHLLAARHRRRVERVLLRLDRASGAGVHHSREALCDHAAHPGRRGRRQEVAGALRPQPVGEREGLVELAKVQVAGKRGRLVDDHLGSDTCHGLPYRGRVQHIQHQRLRPGLAQPGRPGLGGRGTDDRVAGLDELRHELRADGAGGTGDKNLHDELLPRVGLHLSASACCMVGCHSWDGYRRRGCDIAAGTSRTRVPRRQHSRAARQETENGAVRPRRPCALPPRACVKR